MDIQIQSVTVLLVGDHESAPEPVRAALSNARRPLIELRCVDTVGACLKTLPNNPVDVVVLGAAAGDRSEIVRTLRDVRTIAPETAVVVCVDEDADPVVDAALAAGAHDYLVVGSDARLDPELVRRAILLAEARRRAEFTDWRLTSLLNAANDAMIGLGLGGIVRRWNLAAQRIYGRSAAEAIGAPIVDALGAERDAATLWASLQRVAREGRTESLRATHRHAAGHDLDIELSVIAVRNEAGETISLGLIAEDVTARTSALTALERERDRSAAIIAAVGDGYILSIDGRIADVNDAVCTLTGFEREELVGAELPWPFWPPEAIEMSMDLRDRSIGRGVSGRAAEPFEAPMMHKDGTRFIAEVTVSPARNRDGSILGWVSTVRDVSERRNYQAELERLASHDPLTGLANRRLFYQRLVSEMADSIRHDRPLGIAILDLDHFKAVNDVYGHLAGDRALCDVAARLQTVVRKGELLARVGGEEFAWILPEADAEGALIAAERAREAIGATPFGGVGPLTISIGIALREELHEVTALYERADRALYQAKRSGRNRTAMWDPTVAR